MNTGNIRAPIIVIHLMVVLLFAACIYTYGGESWEWSFTSGDFTVEEKEGGHIIYMDGFSLSGSPGNPALPQKVFNIALPPLTDMSSIRMSVTGTDTAVLEGTYSIMPAPPCAKGAGPGREGGLYWGEGKDIRNGKNMNVYGKDTPYPSGVLTLLPGSQMRKWKYARIAFVPFRYDPSSGKLILIRSVSCTLSFETEPLPGAPVSAERQKALVESVTLLNDSVLDSEALPLFYNRTQARSLYSLEKERLETEVRKIGAELALQGVQAVPSPKPSTVYDYVIITTNTIQSSLTKLSSFTTHLQNMGFSPLVITETQYGSLTGQSPDGTAEKIRQWLKNNYSTYSVKYVLLIGDPDPDDPSNGSDTIGDVPMKMMWPRRHDTMYTSDKESPTDYFYADLTGNWDIDGDGYFGEWGSNAEDNQSGGVNFAQEVYVGRIACVGANYTDVDSILQKTINYDTASGDLTWRDRILLPMAISSYANEYSNGGPRTDGLNVPEDVVDDYANSAGFSHYVFYERTGVAPVPSTAKYNNGSDLSIDTTNIVNEWLNHYGCVFWWGHGNQTGAYRWLWTNDTNNPGVPDAAELQFTPFFTSTNCSSLNDSYPSIVYQCSCLNGYPENTGNLGYSLLKNGAVATVSASRVSWYIPGTWSHSNWQYLPDNTNIGYTFFKNIMNDDDTTGIAVFQSRNLTQLSDDTSWDSEGWMNRMDFNLYGAPHVQAGGMPLIVTDTTSVSVNEGSSNTFQVKLSKQPQAGVSVTVAWLSGDTDITVTGGSSLTFTTGNWNTYQTVTLSAAENAVEDADTADGTATIRCSSTSAVNKDVTAQEADDDFTLTVTDDGHGSTTPSTPFVVDQDDSPYNISATADTGYSFNNWTVTAGTGTFGDANSASTTVAASADVTVQANFAANTVNIQTDTNDFNVTEGGTAILQVRLSAQPASGVTVNANVTSGDSDITITGGSSLGFTTGNWSTYQSVTVSAAEDADSVSGSAAITLTSTGLTDKVVTVHETDNDGKDTDDDDDGGCGCSPHARPEGSAILFFILLICMVFLRKGWEERT